MGNLARVFGLATAAALVVASPATAGVPHVVQPGESLWSIAAANNFTTRSLAAANGLSENSNVVLGSTINIPSISEAAAALNAAGITPGAPASGTSSSPSTSAAPAPGGGYAVQPGDTLSGIAAAHGVSLAALAAANGVSPDSFAIAGTTIRIPSASAAPAASSAASSSAPPALGGYTVRPGDTLSGIAAQAGVSMQQLAWMNGLDPSRYLLSGTVLKLPTGAPAPANPAPPPTQRIVPAAAPNPTPERVSSSQIAEIAAQHGVPAGLANAIAWQESGFNNAMVSSANARGVMQIMPGTWDWVNQSLTNGNPLNPNSAIDNVRGGVLYLRQLLNDFGGDQNAAAAAYYQGEGAVKSRGLYPETQQYVNSVNALRSRFGG
jgi:N-acetylmuramoyl-L-alanine amidase